MIDRESWRMDTGDTIKTVVFDDKDNILYLILSKGQEVHPAKDEGGNLVLTMCISDDKEGSAN